MNTFSFQKKIGIKLIMSLFSLIPVFVFGQPNPNVCTQITTVDDWIYRRDVGLSVDTTVYTITKEDSASLNNKNDTTAVTKRVKPETLYVSEIVRKKLIPLLGIETRIYQKDQFIQHLDCIVHTETITWLEYAMNQIIKEAEASIRQRQTPINYPEALKEMLAMIHVRIDEIMSGEFSFYSFTETSKKFVKYIYAEHTNDFLSLLGKNDDRDYTGGFRFEIATDWLKLRFFTGFKDKGWNPNSRNWYSYQSLFLGGEGYTPFIRDTTIFNTPTSVDPDDRPFASYKYWGRAKYRVSRFGHIRILSEIKLGTIGSSAPRVIQSAIHRDITPGSLRPNGWDAQIAAGGRMALGYHVSHEFMLVCKGWLLSPTVTRATRYYSKGHEAFNLSLFDDIRVGHDMTSLGIGLNFSNRNFKQTGGLGIPSLKINPVNKWYQMITSNTILNFRAQYRYVVHNSMLEGYGVFKQTKDEDPTSPTDVHILTGDQVKRNIFLAELSINIRLKYCGILYKQTIMSPEFDLPVNYKTYSFANNGQPGLHNRSEWNHYGTLGLIFKVQ